MRQLVTHTPVHGEVLDYRDCDTHVSEELLAKKGPPTFVGNPVVRAKRIAAAYARVFLEDFHLGDKSKIGRFYWLGLGAFASKQVAATLDTWQVKAVHCSELRAGLGRGNLWLFNDVLAWFYGYAAGADTFEQCANARDSSHFVEQVATNFARQLDHDISIDKVPYEIDGETGAKKAKLGYLKCTQIVKNGFALVAAWEKARDVDRPAIAFSHLIAIAQHEQGEVLQGLIYDNPDFQCWLGLQRHARTISHKIALPQFIRALVPSLQLVLISDYTTENAKYRSDAPDNIIVENYRKRMDWIQKAAEKYHALMLTQQTFMLNQLNTIKSWVGTPDI